MDLVYKAQMLTQGGRTGTVQSDDGSFKLKLAVPAAMGGKGDGPNPEQLFAGAFGACFEQSVRHIAKKGHLPGSLRLDGRNHEGLLLSQAKDRPVFIHCYHGHASQTYAEMFADFGFVQVCDLIGGWEAWCQAGHPIHV